MERKRTSRNTETKIPEEEKTGIQEAIDGMKKAMEGDDVGSHEGGHADPHDRVTQARGRNV